MGKYDLFATSLIYIRFVIMLTIKIIGSWQFFWLLFSRLWRKIVKYIEYNMSGSVSLSFTFTRKWSHSSVQIAVYDKLLLY
jgi:hypothetical protein